MQTPRKTRGSSSVLGKRAHQAEHVARAEQLPTPDITPANKRVKTSVTELDGDHNKENIAPLLIEALNSDISPSSRRRSLNRSTTDTTPSRRRSSKHSGYGPMIRTHFTPSSCHFPCALFFSLLCRGIPASPSHPTALAASHSTVTTRPCTCPHSCHLQQQSRNARPRCRAWCY